MRNIPVITIVCTALMVGAAMRPATRAQTVDDESVTLVGAGDIANCELLGGARATANLLDTISGTIFTVGDHAYPKGTAKELADCYGATWGRHKARTWSSAATIMCTSASRQWMRAVKSIRRAASASFWSAPAAPVFISSRRSRPTARCMTTARMAC